MRVTGATTAVLGACLMAAGCGWSPPGAPPPKPDTCTPADGPDADTVARATAALIPPGPGASWTTTGSGHTTDCRLHWVGLTAPGAAPDAAQQVLFFDRRTPLGPATAEPRPYVSVVTSGETTVTVQYQWRQAGEPPCCPTGIGTVRFGVGDDGRLDALDPIPAPYAGPAVISSSGSIIAA